MMIYNTNVFPIKTIKLSDVYIKCLLARDSPPSPSPLFFFFFTFFQFYHAFFDGKVQVVYSNKE